MPAEVFDNPSHPEPSLADTLARPRFVTVGGKEREIKILDFNDLADLEVIYGDIGTIDTSRVSVQRHMVYFILSRTDPTLTEQEVGASLTLDKAAEVSQFIRKVFSLSGFQSYDEPETESPNATEPVTAPVTGSETSPSGASSPSATRRKK